MSEFSPTLEQRRIKHAFNSTHYPNLAIVARAGSGKTSTARYLTQSTHRRGYYLAYNTKNADEARAKFPPQALVRTTHAMAFHALHVRKRWGHKLKDEHNKWPLWKIVREFSLEPYCGIEAAHIAHVAMTGLRRFMYSADTEIDGSHVYDPTRKWDYFERFLQTHYQERFQLEAPQTFIKECWLGYQDRLLDIAEALWNAMLDPQHPFPMEHDAYLKLWQLKKPVIRGIDYLILDECFPAGTLIKTDSGDVPIEEIVANPSREWRVLSSQDGGQSLQYSLVTSAYKTPINNPLVRILHEEGELVCTANHPLWVSGYGWKAAGALQENDALSCLRNPQVNKVQNMLSILRMPMARNEQKSDNRAATPGENQSADEGGQNRNTQSDEAKRNPGESICYPQEKRNYLLDSRRKWSGADALRTDVIQGIDPAISRWAMENRVCRLEWKADPARIADLLQNRHCVPEIENSYRSGRLFSSRTHRASQGREENQSACQSRVVRVEIFQRGSQRGCESCCDEDSFVYTLSVASGSYFASNVLVKNCQDSNACVFDIVQRQPCQIVLIGDSAQRIYGFRGAKDVLGDLPDAQTLYLSQSFRFGQPIADVANAILTQVYPDLVPIIGNPLLHSRIGKVDQNRYTLIARSNACLFESAVQLAYRRKSFHVVGSLRDPIARARSVYALSKGNSAQVRHQEIRLYEDWTMFQNEARYSQELMRDVKMVEKYGDELPGMCDLLERAGTVPIKQAAVILSTVHKSKGLEYPQVRLANDFNLKIEDGKLAGSQEEHHCLYVAVTRAEQVLELNQVAQFAVDRS